MSQSRITFGLVACAGVLSAAQAFACDDRGAAIAAVQSNDIPAAVALEEAVAIDAGCDAAFRTWFGESIARLYVQLAEAPDMDTAARRAALDQAARRSTAWPIHAQRGLVAFEQSDYAAAAASFQQAVALAEGPNQPPLTAEDVDQLLTMTSEAAALSDEPLPEVRTRSGAIGGLFAASVRGFRVEQVSLPITFEFDSVAFDEKGAIYAERLLTSLLEDAPPSITIAGHTDPVGDEDHNETLSRRRAEAMRAYLVEGGYDGVITVEWFGETQVPEPPSGVEPDSEEHYRLARRVELRR